MSAAIPQDIIDRAERAEARVADLKEALAWMISVAAMQGASLPSAALDFADDVTKRSKQTPWGAVKSAIAKLEVGK